MDNVTTAWIWPWWTTMVLINLCNLALCAHFYRQSYKAPDGQTRYPTQMRVLGLIFTLVALYRAIFVSRYLFQYAWFDTLANSSLLIRGFAWAAELSFAGLFALALLRFSADLPGRNQGRLAAGYEKAAPYALFICLFIAQFFATIGLISKSRLSFAIEESLWSAGFIAILPLAVMQFRRIVREHWSTPAFAMHKTSCTVILVWCVIYCSYGAIYHLPTEYWATAFEQLETGVPPIKTGWSAVADAFSVVNVTHRYEDWGFGFFLWHSAYFSVCVWLALLLMRAPRRAQNESGR